MAAPSVTSLSRRVANLERKVQELNAALMTKALTELVTEATVTLTALIEKVEAGRLVVEAQADRPERTDEAQAPNELAPAVQPSKQKEQHGVGVKHGEVV